MLTCDTCAREEKRQAVKGELDKSNLEQASRAFTKDAIDLSVKIAGVGVAAAALFKAGKPEKDKAPDKVRGSIYSPFKRPLRSEPIGPLIYDGEPIEPIEILAKDAVNPDNKSGEYYRQQHRALILRGADLYPLSRWKLTTPSVRRLVDMHRQTGLSVRELIGIALGLLEHVLNKALESEKIIPHGRGGLSVQNSASRVLLQLDTNRKGTYRSASGLYLPTRRPSAVLTPENLPGCHQSRLNRRTRSVS
jgi:hypothetical protein